MTQRETPDNGSRLDNNGSAVLCSIVWDSQCFLGGAYSSYSRLGEVIVARFKYKANYRCGSPVTLEADSQRAITKAVIDCAKRDCPACEMRKAQKGETLDKIVESVGKDVWLTKRAP